MKFIQTASSLRPQLKRWQFSSRWFSSSALTETFQTHQSNLAALQSLGATMGAQPPDELWRSWLSGNGSTAAAGLWHAAVNGGDWKAASFLSYALWYHDGVPAVHTQAARWAAWDLASAGIKSAPHVAPTSQGPEHSAFAAACTVLHMLAPRRWGRLPIARPAAWLQRAAAVEPPPAAHPWSHAFTLLAHHQTARRSTSGNEAAEALLQHASSAGLLPASHAYAVLLRAEQGKPLLHDLGSFFDQPWASIARAAAASGWTPSGVLLGQSLLQVARSCRKEAAKGDKGAFKRATQLQRKGAEYLHSAAGTGSIDAAAALGVMLRSGGAGMAPHLAEARRLLQRAAEHGHINAMFHLALLHRDAAARTEYHQWLEQAARGGHVAAQQHLAKEKPQLAEAILAGNIQDKQ